MTGRYAWLGMQVAATRQRCAVSSVLSLLCEFLLSNTGHQVYVASTVPVEPSCQPPLPLLIRLQPRWIKTFPASFNHCLLKSYGNTEDECFSIQIQGFSWCSPSNLLFYFYLSKNQSTFWGLKETSTLSEGLPVSVLVLFSPGIFLFGELLSFLPMWFCCHKNSWLFRGLRKPIKV